MDELWVFLSGANLRKRRRLETAALPSGATSAQNQPSGSGVHDIIPATTARLLVIPCGRDISVAYILNEYLLMLSYALIAVAPRVHIELKIP